MSTFLTAKNAEEIVANYVAASAEFKEAVEDRFHRAAEEAGLLDTDGNLAADEVVNRIYDEIKTKHVKNVEPGNDDRYDPATSSTKEELTAAVFTAGPTAADAERNAVEKKAYEKCLSTVWNHTVTTKRGGVQKRLDHDKLLLVRGTVYRNSNTIASGVYVTTNAEAVLREYLGPRLAELRKLTDALESDFELAVERDKGLAAPLRAAIESAVVEAVAKLPIAALVSANGQKAIGK